MQLGCSTQSVPLSRWTGELPRTHGYWRVCCCVECACEEVDWVWDVEFIGEEEQQEVVLVCLELVTWMVNLGFVGRYFFWVYDFDDLYDFC